MTCFIIPQKGLKILMESRFSDLLYLSACMLFVIGYRKALHQAVFKPEFTYIKSLKNPRLSGDQISHRNVPAGSAAAYCHLPD